MMQRVLLTGATGFLGSHLLEALINEGHQVVILKRSTSDTWRINHLLECVIAYDVDKQPIEAAFEQQKIDAVIHTACHYGRNQDSICNVVEGNLMFALRVLEAAVHFNANTFFNTDTLLPKNINTYSLSKHQFAEWLKQSRKNMQCLNIKIEHMYGPKDDKTKFVPWLLDQMVNSNEEIKLTQGTQKRDFVYIDDVVSAYMLLLNKIGTLPKWSEFDVGTNQLVTIKEFVCSLQTIVEASMGIHIDGRLNFGAIPYREGEIMEPVINNATLVQAGWQPKITLDNGLQKVLKELQ